VSARVTIPAGATLLPAGIYTLIVINFQRFPRLRFRR
jgi:hypothetical protein